MVDALASGASVLRDVEVQVLSRVPKCVFTTKRTLTIVSVLFTLYAYIYQIFARSSGAR